MKKFLLLFFCFLSVSVISKAQSSYTDILNNTIFIDGLEVAKFDLPKLMTWKEAKTVCDSLGNGWRLPDMEELNMLYRNQKIIGGFSSHKFCGYWSNRLTKKDEKIAFFKSFDKGHVIFYPRGNPKRHVRIVRNWTVD